MSLHSLLRFRHCVSASVRLVCFDVEGGGDGSALDVLRQRGEPKWGGSNAVDSFKQGVVDERETVFEAREARDMDGPIDPRQDILYGLPDDTGENPREGIVPKLEYLRKQILPERFAEKFSGPERAKYDRVLRKISEAYMLQAVVNNGSENELINRFTSKMEALRNKLDNTRDLAMILDYVGAFFKWFVESKEWNLPGENPKLQVGPIKPSHKSRMRNQLGNLEKYYKARLEGMQDKWYNWGRYMEGAVTFFENVELPMHQEWYLNTAILKQWPPEQLAEEYSDFLRLAYTECLKPEYRRDQALVDAGEKNMRVGLTAWQAVLSGIMAATRD